MERELAKARLQAFATFKIRMKLVDKLFNFKGKKGK